MRVLRRGNLLLLVVTQCVEGRLDVAGGDAEEFGDLAARFALVDESLDRLSGIEASLGDRVGGGEIAGGRCLDALVALPALALLLGERLPGAVAGAGLSEVLATVVASL